MYPISKVNCAYCNRHLFVNDVTCTRCSHAFHNHCITQFLKSSRSCPECKLPVKPEELRPLFFTESHNLSIEDEIEQLIKATDQLILQKKLQNAHLHQFALRRQEEQQLQEDFKALNKELNILENIQKLIDSSAKDFDNILANTEDPAVLKGYLSFLKTEAKTKLAKEKAKMRKIQGNLKHEEALQMEIRKKLMSREEDIKADQEKITELEKKLASHPPTAKPPNVRSKPQDGEKTKRTKKTTAPRK